MAKVKPEQGSPQGATERERLYTVDEMCQILNVDRRTMVDWVQQHRIPYVRVNGELVRFRMSDIAAWLKKKERQPQRSRFTIK